MVRDQSFTVMMSDEEKQALDYLAKRLHRSRGDVVRLIVREMFKRLGLVLE